MKYPMHLAYFLITHKKSTFTSTRQPQITLVSYVLVGQRVLKL